MRYLAKNFSVKTLTLQLIFVAIIAVSIAGVARHSPLLEWSALVAILVLLVADPLASHDKVAATPSTAGVKDSAVRRRILAPNKAAESIADSVALINSQVKPSTWAARGDAARPTIKYRMAIMPVG